jgi:hypothetical protein
VSDGDIARLKDHIHWAIKIASQLNLRFLEHLLLMVQLELANTRDPQPDVSASRRACEAKAFGVVGSWNWDLVSNLIYADAEVARLHGVPVLDAQIGTSLEAFMPSIAPEDMGRIRKLIERATRTGGAYRAIYRLILPGEKAKRILAIGRVELDQTRRPVRFPGTVLELGCDEALHARNSGDPVLHNTEEAALREID